jgi:DNA-binding response OmpR family regulator
MPIGSRTVHYPVRILCVRSNANAPALDVILNRFDVTVVHDGDLAGRKARFGVYDCYVAADARTAKAAVYVWNAIRAFDRNTPFVLFAAEALPVEAESQLRSGFDAYVRYPGEGSELHLVIEYLLNAAEERSLDARVAETNAIAGELNTRLADLSRRVLLSKQSLARAQEHVMRAHALRTFSEYGGTRSLFDRYWPEIFESTLRESYGAQARSIPGEQFSAEVPRR